jgi:hypothetical protein
MFLSKIHGRNCSARLTKFTVERLIALRIFSVPPSRPVDFIVWLTADQLDHILQPLDIDCIQSAACQLCAGFKVSEVRRAAPYS